MLKLRRVASLPLLGPVLKRALEVLMAFD
jgi:hypothetical protein